MKRDMNLVRHILLHIESPTDVPFDAMGHDQRSILDHMELLAKAGYLEADFLPGENGKIAGLLNEKLTWDGHNFIDDARNESTWKTAMSKVGTTVGSASLEVIKATVAEVSKAALGLK
jgi:hypothetical protein